MRASGFSLALFSFHNLNKGFPVVIVAAGFLRIFLSYLIKFLVKHYDYALPSVRIAGFFINFLIP